MSDENMMAAISRAQETANQAFDLAKATSGDLTNTKERVSEMGQRLTFTEKVLMNHADTMKSCTDSVTAIQISNAGISNEVKNMGLTSNRIEQSIATFMTNVNKGFDGFRGEIDTLNTNGAAAGGSYKTWAIILGGGFLLIQTCIPLAVAHFTPTPAIQVVMPSTAAR